MWNKQRYCWQLQNHVWIQNFRQSNWKITMLGKPAYLFVVLWYGGSCQEMCGTILWVGKPERLNNSTRYQLHAMKTIISKKKNWNLARSITKWTKACEKRLSRLISYIHHTCEYKQYGHVGNTAKHCRLGLFQDDNFSGDLEDWKSTSGGTLCVFGSHTFVPISWSCKKQTSVLHSSTESEIISLDAGLRLDGIPALDLCDLIVAVLHGNAYQSNQERGDLCTNQRKVREVPRTLQKKRKKSHGMINDLDNADLFPHTSILLVRKLCWMCLKTTKQRSRWSYREESPTMRHVSRTHRVALDWLFDRINLESKIQIKYFDTKNQLADILTKGKWTRDEWNHLLCLFNISHFSSTNWLEVMSKRTQEDSGEERVTAKSKPMMNLVSRCSVRNPDVLASTKARWKPNMKVKYLWARGMSSSQEREDLQWTLIHLTKSGLLKSGNLV